MNNELEQYIKLHFGVIDANELKTISSLFELITIKKGDYFIKHGKRADKLSFVKDGLLRIFAQTGKQEITQWISSKGYFVADISGFVFDNPSRWNIQALVDTQIYTISKDKYNSIGDFIPKWNKVEKLFIVRCFTIMEDRIFSHLSMTAQERYILFFENNKELFNHVPLQYIASMLGMTPETFSRIRKKTLL
ncbi:MAG: Crp/Fnr family transcriptional regulator [Flavobacteriaceae bacterium]|nr:Crp/Fnr family transcriptional regulator [Flavobacteriaceae bacterium]